MLELIILGMASVLVSFGLLIPLSFRRVVTANEVHIVQASRKTISYGIDTQKGNCYYEFPAWIPFIGVNKMVSQ